MSALNQGGLLTRSVTPNGDRVKALRIRKGWTREKLAHAAGLDTKTLAKVEASGSILLGTLKRVAEALQVEFQELLTVTALEGLNGLLGAGSAPLVAPPAGDRQEVVFRASLTLPNRLYEVVIKDEFASFDGEKLKAALAGLIELAGLKGEVAVRGIEPGSVRIKLEVSAEDAARLQKAFEAGALEPLHVIRANDLGPAPEAAPVGEIHSPDEATPAQPGGYTVRPAPSRTADYYGGPDVPAATGPHADFYDQSGWKRIIEFQAALVLLVLAAPVILLCALLVKLTSRGPALYSQTRVGRAGRPFRLFKLRTMIHGCEALTVATWRYPGDPRVTAVGRFLRRNHFDELPQLWNVLRGDMSLVGPRPERPEFVGILEEAIPGYRGRLEVRPGITGLAQVLLPADTDLESVRRKLALDLTYVRLRSAGMDFKILVATGLKLLRLPGGGVARLLGLPTEPSAAATAEVDVGCQKIKPESLRNMAAVGQY